MSLVWQLSDKPQDFDEAQASAQVYGEEPSPWVLLVWESADSTSAPEQERAKGRRLRAESLATSLSELTPTRAVVSSNGMSHVHLSSFDLVVAFGSFDTSYMGTMDVIQFGGVRLGTVTASTRPVTRTSLSRTNISYSRKWVVRGNLPNDVKSLVKTDLLRLVPTGTRDAETHPRGVSTLSVQSSQFGEQPLQVLLEDVDGQIVSLAHCYNWSAGSEPRWHWVFPGQASDDKWVPLILTKLHDVRPNTYPLRSAWSEARQSQTYEERIIYDQIHTLEQKKRTFLKEYETESARLEAGLRVVVDSAETGIRRLVTAQGDSLLSAVDKALSRLGFAVAKADNAANRGDLLEDLIVTMPGVSEGVALAEVRGYSRGAQLADLQRIGRFVSRYQQRNSGVLPDRRWYIVNHSIKSGPSGRMRPLASNPSEVEVFAEDSGLVIDTSDLLRLYNMVECDELTASSARELLWNTFGYFDIP